MKSRLGKLVIGGITTTMGVGLAYYIFLTDKKWPAVLAARKTCKAKGPLPTRQMLIESLKNDSFDVLIIGGGATGVGCALDAATRGLKTALVEADDFGSGTSSRSTKLVHGGVRYLQKAITEMDMVQFSMVKQALEERSGLLQTAPHLVQPLPIMLPVYSWWQLPYYWLGIKMYDLIAASKNIRSSYILSRANALNLFPILKSEHLCGAIVYYDGLMDDARLNLALALTAIRYGATVVNHVTVTSFIKDELEGKECITAVNVEDELSGEKWCVPAKCVINATGSFTDCIRKMDNPCATDICSPSSGVHVTLPGFYSPEGMGLLDPSTSDGRVIFFLPWQNHTIAGTTDLPCDVTFAPTPAEEEVTFILNEINNYLNKDLIEVRRTDVLAAWSGVRPLVSDPDKPNTESLARNHIIDVSDSGLVTIAGGKWTTYRCMAKDAIDVAIARGNLKPRVRGCKTAGLLVEGAHEWTPTLFIKLVQECGLDTEVAMHLATTYGDRATNVADMAQPTGLFWPINGKRLHPALPFIEAEVRYCAKNEYAVTAVDLIARRIRISFLNADAAEDIMSEVVSIMAEELGWGSSEKKKQEEAAKEFLQDQMGSGINHIQEIETETYTKKFQEMDKKHKGCVPVKLVEQSLGSEMGLPVEKIHDAICEVNLNVQDELELDEYLKVVSVLKAHVKAEGRDDTKLKTQLLKQKICVERSCGGL